MALRVDASRGPATETLVRRGASARAANGLRSQSKIVAQESPVRAIEGLCCARPSDEHTIWQCEMSLKGASRGSERDTLVLN